MCNHGKCFCVLSIPSVIAFAGHASHNTAAPSSAAPTIATGREACCQAARKARGPARWQERSWGRLPWSS